MTKNLQPQIQNGFLGHTQPVPQHYISQSIQVQQPFLEKTNHVQQPFLGSQDNQKQIMDLLLSLNQRMTNLEKFKIQG